MKKIEVNGPYYKFSSPFGKATLPRDEWFVSRLLEPNEQITEIQKILKSVCLGNIVKFKDRKDYCISQLYPSKYFKTLKKAVNFLVKNEGKLVFCS